MADSNAVIERPEHHRFELAIGQDVAFITYHAEGETLTLRHTEVPAFLEGHGVGSALVRGTIDLIRVTNRRFVPQCPFVAAYVERHPELRDLVAD